MDFIISKPNLTVLLLFSSFYAILVLIFSSFQNRRTGMKWVWIILMAIPFVKIAIVLMVFLPFFVIFRRMIRAIRSLNGQYNMPMFFGK
jgi:hypothetical protein